MLSILSSTGHGGRVTDTDGDEDDGYDEILIPGDFKENGHIVDDWIYSEFVTKVQAGVHVVALIDCCHSGTAMDLPYVCNVGENEIRRSEGFSAKSSRPPPRVPSKSEKDTKKKKKASTEKKSKKPEKKEKKTGKPKPSKKKEPEPEPEPDVADQDYDEEEELQEEEEEDYDYDYDPEPEPEPEAQEEKSKKKRGIFGFGKKK